MINIIYSEIIKLKKSYVSIIALIGGFLIPVMQCVTAITEHYNEIPQVERESFIVQYISNIESMSFEFLYTILFSLIAAYIFEREFMNKTSSILYSYPFSRMKIFMGKLITIDILILFVYVIQILSSYLGLYIIWGQLPLAEFIIKDLKVNIYSVLFQFIIIPIPILICNITKSIIFSVVYGVLGTISSVIMTFAGIYMQCSPVMLPGLPLYNIYRGDPIDFILVSMNIILTLGISMSFCIYQYNTMEIK